MTRIAYRAVVATAVVCLTALLIGADATARAAERPDPLRLVPDVADVVLKVEQPRRIAELATALAKRPELEGFRGYRDYFGSTNYQLFRQLVGHFEHELGHDWPELLDRLGGGGLVVAIKIEKKNQAPVLFVLQGDDPKLTRKFFDTFLEVARQERARQGIKDDYEKETYRGVETWKLGDQAFAAVLDAALVYSNKPAALHAAIDLHLDASKDSSKRSMPQAQSMVDARKLLPADPLVWGWVNLEKVKKAPELKPLFALPANFFPIQLGFGGLIDVVKRSPFVVAALHEEQGGVALAVRFPRGTNGMHDLIRGRVPADSSQGPLPLLEPSGVLYSTSYFLDLNSYWQQRAKLLPADQLAKIDEFEKTSDSFLAGTKLSRFFEYAGARQRIVVARQQKSGYAVEPKSRVPAFGLVLELREPEKFAQAIDGPIRGVAFLGAIQAPLTPIDEDRGGAKIIGYRFVENDANKARNDGQLFNFSPCRVRVGNQMAFCSTVELARQLADELQKQGNEAKETTNHSNNTNRGVVLQSRFYWNGLSSYLTAIEKTLVTQNMLQQGNSPEEAAKEVSLFLKLLDHLGRLESAIHFEPEEYHVDLRSAPTAEKTADARR